VAAFTGLGGSIPVDWVATFTGIRSQSPEEFKSWSQNLGHEDVLTILYSYGHVQQHRQGEIFQQLKSPRPSTSQNADDIARAVIKAMAEKSSPIGI